jgi:hypothetical protein
MFGSPGGDFPDIDARSVTGLAKNQNVFYF